MRSKRLFVSLTKDGSIDNIIKELNNYKKELVDREKLFCERLADIGVNAAMLTLAFKGHGDSSREASFNVSFTVDGEMVNGVLSVTSTPNITKDGRVFYPHLAWEFGAGNYFNGMTSPSPDAKKLGMGPGTFPEQRHVPDPGYWYYRDRYGDAVRSYGTQASMPMHAAVVEMLKNIETVAREVYGGM